MPRLAIAISNEFTARLRTIERARAKIERLFLLGHVKRHDVDLFYEGIFLRTVTSFEGLLEELFIGLLTGGIQGSGVHPRVNFRSAAVARDIVLSGRPYVVWLPYSHTENRAAAFFRAGEPFSLLASADKSFLTRMLIIRHAVAHESRTARRRFEKEVLRAASLLPMERTPGGFLRSVFRATPRQTQYEEIAASCALLSRKLCK